MSAMAYLLKIGGSVRTICFSTAVLMTVPSS